MARPGVLNTQKQILPLNEITKFSGRILRADSRRRIEFCSTFKKIFSDIDSDCNYVIEVSLSKEKLLERLKELIEKEQIIPAFIYFNKG